MTWFEKLFGFDESAENVHRHIHIHGDQMHSNANDRTFTCGTLTVPSLGALNASAETLVGALPGTLTVHEVVADAGALHADPANAGALFQVASQFNLLEMPAPSVTPAAGITDYEHDHTQGPACALACAAGTLQRNWFEQTTEAQIDTLAAVGEDFNNQLDENGNGRWWNMENGYALGNGQLPDELHDDALISHDDLAIGLHTSTEVTKGDAGHLVTQAYCAAVPAGYSEASADELEPLARLVLNSAYEATLAAALINATQPGGSPKVFLTLLGGGVFHNPEPWIIEAIDRAIGFYADTALEIAIVSYGAPNPRLRKLLR